MTKLIAVFIVLLVLFGGWEFYKYCVRFQKSQETGEHHAAARIVSPDQLPGMPYQLQPSLEAAEKQGPAALLDWLKTYSAYVHDPRLAWIQLDYCVMISRDNPQEARRVFDAVKRRTPPTSPVWPRIQELSKSYE